MLGSKIAIIFSISSINRSSSLSAAELTMFKASILSLAIEYLGRYASIWERTISNSSFSVSPTASFNARIAGASRLIWYRTFPSCSLIRSHILQVADCSLTPGNFVVLLLLTTESSTAILIRSLILSGILADDFSTWMRASLLSSLRMPIRIQLPQEINRSFLYK